MEETGLDVSNLERYLEGKLRERKVPFDLNLGDVHGSCGEEIDGSAILTSLDESMNKWFCL